MKKRNVVTGICCALMVVFTAVSALCGEVYRLGTDEFFYGGMSRMAVMDTLGAAGDADVSARITAYIGMDDAQQDVFAQETAAFMRGETEAQSGALNDKERQHMLDVRRLIALAQTVSQALVSVSAALAVAAAWTGSKGKRSAAAIGALAGVLIIAGAAGVAALLMNTQGFEALFVGMHELLFTNDLWLLDPRTDVLIRMMPQLLFERAAMDILRQSIRMFVITAAMLAAVYHLVGGMIRRNLSKRENA